MKNRKGKNARENTSIFFAWKEVDIVIIICIKEGFHLKLEVWNPGCESVRSLYWQSVVDHLLVRLTWFPSIFVRFNTIPSIFVNHRARWNHVRTINPPHQRVLRIHFNLLNFSSKWFSVHRALPWTSAGGLPQTGQHWKPEKKHARNDLRVSYWCFIHTPSKWLWSWTQILIDWKLRTEQKQFNLSLSTMVNFVGNNFKKKKLPLKVLFCF